MRWAYDAQTSPISPTEFLSPTPEDSYREYALHPAERVHAVFQRLWLALVLEDTGVLDLDPETLNTNTRPPGPNLFGGINRELTIGLWRQLRGDSNRPSKPVQASLDFLLDHPQVLISALRHSLLQMELNAKQHYSGDQPLGTCPFDASTRLKASPEGTIYCPREQDLSHQPTGPVGMSMLLAHHYKPRIGDLEWVEELVGIHQGQHVVDIGAGTGSYTFPLAERVGHSGKVLALEIDPSLIEYLEFMTQALQTPNVESVENLEEDLLLPDSVADLVLIVDLDRCSRLPSEFFSGTLGEQIRDSLKPDGHLVILRSYSTPSYEVYEEILAPKGLVLKAREQRLTRELLVFQQP